LKLHNLFNVTYSIDKSPTSEATSRRPSGDQEMPLLL